MLLTINIGNRRTEIGLLDGTNLTHHWRTSTADDRTPDEYALLLRGLLGDQIPNLTAAAVASVVPAAAQSVSRCLDQMVGHVLMVGPGVKTGMPMAVDNPREVGADRVAQAVAVKELHGCPAVVVGFGTAVTVDVLGPEGAFLGGAIAAGIDITLDSLVNSTAALRRVALTPPEHAIGRSTNEAIQSGMVYGFVGMVDGLVARVIAELGTEPIVVATGDGAEMLVPLLSREYVINEFLVLRGLGLLSARNR